MRADLGRRLTKEVEEAEMQRRRERLAQPAGCLGGRLVPETGRGGEILLDRLYVCFELHRDITMTSHTTPVKRHLDSVSQKPLGHLTRTQEHPMKHGFNLRKWRRQT